ncbi:hypothetical protein KY348_01215 [Candidatus Woesearchaeota archaeon]|nr:hypothetical protein [Candidatus Woesearchaeota archaeon]
MAKMRGGMRKHFCQEEELTDIDYFTSQNKSLNEAAGLSFEQNTPSHLRGLKDFEIEFLLNNRNTHHRCKR